MNPMQDVVPPSDGQDGPQSAAVTMHQAPSAQSNPIAGGHPAQAPQPQQEPPKDAALEKDLKDVNKEVKAADKKPKQKSSKPVLAITFAVLVAIGLSAAAYLAYRKP